MQRFTLVAACLLLATIVCAQKEAHHWLFGAGLHLDFNSTPPTLSQDSKINTYEGCTTVSDESGRLLLYSDGITLWNGRHEVIEGGTDLNGHASSTQSGIIIRKPGSRDRFFVFTVDARERAMAKGLSFSEVDMAAREGRGAVVRKNVALVAPGTEKVTGAAHGNGVDIWVITHKWNSNEFYAYRVTAAGVDTVPVISKAGSLHNGHLANSIGQLKVAPTGDKIAVAIHEKQLIEVFSFDNHTGVVSRPRKIPVTQGKPYGLEFSPRGNLLYVSTLFFGDIAQYDLTVKNVDDLVASRLAIRPGDSTSVGALQLGPDGRIYAQVEGANCLGIINNPGGRGAQCFYREKGVSMPKGAGRYGLPVVVQTYLVEAERPPVAPATVPEKCVVAVSVLEKKYAVPDNPNSALLGHQPLAGAGVDITVGTAKKQLKTTRNARFTLRVHPDSALTVAAEMPGYFRNSRTLNDLRARMAHGGDTLQMELVLDKIFVDREVVLDDIFYEFNDFKLRSDARPALGKLVALLQENPAVRIEIAAHTDCRGNDHYNLTLSQKRAQSVVDYLVAGGIDAARLVAVGYGKTLPAEPCACATCTDEQHQRNRRTTFKVKGL